MTSTSNSALQNNAVAPAPLNQNQPQSQADWQQILNQLASWQQGLQTLGVTTQLTPAEIGAGSTPVNYAYGTQPLNLLRYGADPTGLTDSSAALQKAINVALAASGSGKYGIDIYAPAGAYLITIPPTFGSATTAILPITIYGDGDSTQFIQNNASGTGPLFDFTGKNGERCHDFLICGNDGHKNDGIWAGSPGGTEQIHWRFERITFMVAGRGLKIADTNNGVVSGCRFWPNNPPGLIIPQTVTRSNILEHIFCPGGFVNFVAFRDNVTPCSTGFGGTGAFVMNCTSALGVIIDGLDTETYDGTQGAGLVLQPGAGEAFRVGNVYCEQSFQQFSNIQNSFFGPITDGGSNATPGVFDFQSTCRQNIIVGVNVATIEIIDSASTGNTFLGCQARSVFTDNTEAANLSGQPNRFIGCLLPGFNVPDLGGNWRKTVSPGATFNSDTYLSNSDTVRVLAPTMTIVAPLHPRNGQRHKYTVRNETVGAVTITFSGFNSPPWTNPLAGQKRSIEFEYNSDFNEWDFLWYSHVDSPN